MYSEDALLPISALQHYLYCPRQCALIHVEQVWVENVFTAEGRLLHERVDRPQSESRGGVRVAYGLLLRSMHLGLTGRADVVEFHASQGKGGRKVPFPVEYKRGRPKQKDWDRIQLCAQAMCLEEMLATDVPEGALFYGKTRRREQVVFDERLRSLTAETARALHELVALGVTPPPVADERCAACSLAGRCLPKAGAGKTSARAYTLKAMREL